MSSSNDLIKDELLQIKIAIELDQGKSPTEVSKKFGVKLFLVKAISKKTRADQPHTKIFKKKRYSETEREVLVERILAGENLEELVAEVGISESTLRRWCKRRGVIPPRTLEQISLGEQQEIRELLEEQVCENVALAYNISRDTIQELQEPAYRQLNTETLSYLFELIREQPGSSSKKLCGIAKGAGLYISEYSVSSYRKRLKSLNII